MAKDIPKIIGPPRSEMPVLVFTDGACEPSGTTVGGVVIDGVGPVEYFGLVIPESVVNSWRTKVGQKQVIGQAELFPVLVARLTWRSRIAGKRVFYFIDNESARLALVKSYSPCLSSSKIVMSCLAWDQEALSSPWYARVPTHSNIADAPSRMTVNAELVNMQARCIEPRVPTEWSASGLSELGVVRSLRPSLSPTA